MHSWLIKSEFHSHSSLSEIVWYWCLFYVQGKMKQKLVIIFLINAILVG